MKIKNLKLKHFRNFNHLSLNFSNHLNIFFGANGQGKTNLLESLILLSTCKSHRVQDDQHLIQLSKQFSDIQITLDSNQILKNIRIFLNENGKSLFIDKKNIKKTSEFIGVLNAILFCPDDLNIFSHTPKSRRKFVDIEIGKVSRYYTKLMNDYYILLRNRNHYLKQEKVNLEFLEIITNQMIDIQEMIIYQRNKFIEDLLYYANVYYQKMTNNDSKIQCEYKTVVDHFDDLKIQLQKKYNENIQKDMKYKQTSLGIHKDDFIFKVDGHLVIDYLSQGQKRIVVLCLKLGLLNMIYKIIKQYPILLLDDIFSELDENNQLKILNYIPKDVQIFLTSCDVRIKSIATTCSIFEVVNGTVQ